MYFTKDGGSHLVWYGLRLGTKCRKYCNKSPLICNMLRAVSKIEVVTGCLKEIRAGEQFYPA